MNRHKLSQVTHLAIERDENDGAEYQAASLLFVDTYPDYKMQGGVGTEKSDPGVLE